MKLSGKAWFRRIVVNHLSLSIHYFLLIQALYVAFPSLRSQIGPWIWLSYLDETRGLYRTGSDDLKLIASLFVLFAGVRHGVMQYVLMPTSTYLQIIKPKLRERFVEQGWLLIYASVFWTTGLFIYATSSYAVDLSGLWTNFPSPAIHGLTKVYYLAQLAFWLQQIVVIHLEEQRKDHMQMLVHHIITSLLILLSYGHYQTRIGNVILVLMDVVDVILPVAKMLQYCNYHRARDVTFGIFVAVRFIARHLLYMRIWYSVYNDSPRLIEWGCYDPGTGAKLDGTQRKAGLQDLLHAFRDDREPVCVDGNIHKGFLVLLAILQFITLIWLVMICRVAYRVLAGQGARDSRSQDESEHADDYDDQRVDSAVEGSKLQYQLANTCR